MIDFLNYEKSEVIRSYIFGNNPTDARDEKYNNWNESCVNIFHSSLSAKKTQLADWQMGRQKSPIMQHRERKKIENIVNKLNNEEETVGRSIVHFVEDP